jgi:hypothetical protein
LNRDYVTIAEPGSYSVLRRKAAPAL